MIRKYIPRYLINLFKNCYITSIHIITFILIFFSDEIFKYVNNYEILKSFHPINIRISILVVIFLLVTSYYIYKYLTINSKEICGDNYKIIIEYSDIFDKKDCKKIINFDEYFTTNIGKKPGDIKPSSICGQFIGKYGVDKVNEIINNANLTCLNGISNFQNRKKYKLGTIIHYEDFYLMAFAPLNHDGRAMFTSRDEFLDCLKNMWLEVFKHYDQTDICLPILGSGQTEFDSLHGASISKQDLLNLIILSYESSSRKVKLPAKLYIVTKKSDDFSLNKVKSFTY